MDRPNPTAVVETAPSCGVFGGALTGRPDALRRWSACRQEAHRAHGAGPRLRQANTAAVNNQARAVQHQARKLGQAAVTRCHELIEAKHQLASTRQRMLLR